MSLEEKLNADLKNALKAGEKTKVSAFRMAISEIKNRKIADRAEKLEDEKVAGIIQKMVRQHKESIEQFKRGGREDLAKKEEEELAVLKEYMPEEISPEELEKIVSESIAETGVSSPKDMGKVMKDVMGRVQGRADGKVISEIVKKKLGQMGAKCAFLYLSLY
jgi:uncharacterized protein YqeY